MKLLFIFFASFIIFVNFIEAEHDYCSLDYTFPCRNFAKEFTLCGASGDFHKSCPKNAKMVAFDEEQLLDFLNTKRQLVAKGSLHTKAISKMNELHWCKQLAIIADKSVKLCNLNTLCVKSFRFENAQIFSIKYPFVEKDTSINLSFLNKWWEEYFSNKSNKAGYAYFTYDLTTHVGCAASRYTQYTDHKLLFACVFSHSPLYGKLYDDGPPASACTSGKPSEKYTGLCATLQEDLKKVEDVC